jgi:hypothetical protein
MRGLLWLSVIMESMSIVTLNVKVKENAPQYGKPRFAVVDAPVLKARRKVWGTVLFGIIAIQILQLILQTSVAQGVYQLADLQHQLKSLSLDNQILQEDLWRLSSLKHLDNEAKAMGMIPSPASARGWIDLNKDVFIAPTTH